MPKTYLIDKDGKLTEEESVGTVGTTIPTPNAPTGQIYGPYDEVLLCPYCKSECFLSDAFNTTLLCWVCQYEGPVESFNAY